MVALLETSQPLSQRRNWRQRARHRDEDKRKSDRRHQRPTQSQRDDFVPYFGDFIGGIGDDEQRAVQPAGQFDARDAGAWQRQRREPARRPSRIAWKRGRLGAIEKNAQMPEFSGFRQQPGKLGRRIWRRLRAREVAGDEILTQPCRRLSLSADTSSGMQHQKGDSERQPQRQNGSEH